MKKRWWNLTPENLLGTDRCEAGIGCGCAIFVGVICFAVAYYMVHVAIGVFRWAEHWANRQ